MDKKPKNGSRGGGRPKIPIITESIGDLEGKLPPRPIILEQVMYWMDLGGTAEEIAGSFHVSVDTLDRRLKEVTNLGFAELKEKVCGDAKLKLRQNQFKLSESNATMGIWLGKQWLGQKEEIKEMVSEEVFSVLSKLLERKNIS
ncbi:MAG: helix-turn-helix transcriptional regulator [Simkania sp.]|nr:helix-turn-helix transcriptional regulator [Simkania sp.]